MVLCSANRKKNNKEKGTNLYSTFIVMLPAFFLGNCTGKFQWNVEGSLYFLYIFFVVCFWDLYKLFYDSLGGLWNKGLFRRTRVKM